MSDVPDFYREDAPDLTIAERASVGAWIMRDVIGKGILEDAPAEPYDPFEGATLRLTPAEKRYARLPKKALDPSLLRQKDALTLSEVALALSLSKRTVEDAVKKGYLRSVKIGNARRVTRAQLETYVLGLEIEHGFRRPKGL